MNRLPPSPIGAATDNESRRDRITRLVDECLVRLTEGQSVSEAALLQTHEDLMPELGEELRRLRLFAGACQQADDIVRGSPDPEQDGTPQVAPVAGRDSLSVSASGVGLPTPHIRIRCPHCHSSIDVHVETSLADVACTACGQRFNLVGDEPITPGDGANRQLQHFELLKQIGTGGFGTVWKARDKELDRLVAVKFPRRGQLSPDETQQFLREARAAAQLRHPNIVSVHEVGRDADRVYIVSDLVDGPSLAEWNTTQRLNVREAAMFCQKVAEALSHAHAAGIIHRDLKPANILIDAAGQPHLTDFGLASRRAQETTVTLDGQMLGTPAYMSPEQARGESHSADPQSDIFSLGVILYELLTGELPFRGSVRMLLEQIIADDPARLRSLNSVVPRDLETICLKCLEKDPARRYATARDLADDLGRFLHGEPIAARPIPRTERTWRWCKRKPAQALLAAATVLVAVGASLFAVREVGHRREAQGTAQETYRKLYFADMHRAMEAWDSAQFNLVVQLLDVHRPQPDREDLRGFEWYYLWRQCRRGLESIRLPQSSRVLGIACSPDGSLLAVLVDNELTMWDLDSRRLRWSIPQATLRVGDVAFSPDGSSITANSDESTIALWNSQTGKLIKTFDPSGEWVHDQVFSPDGQLVAAGSLGNAATLWDVETGKIVRTLPHETMSPTFAVAVSPNGHTLASGNEDGNIRLWDWTNGEPIASLPRQPGRVRALAFSQDGQSLVSGHGDGTVRVWNVAERQVVHAMTGHRAWVCGVAISPDDRTIASASDDRTVKLWDTLTGDLIETLVGHASDVRCVTFSRDGKSLITASNDQQVKLWNLTSSPQVELLPGPVCSVNGLTISHDGREVASVSGCNVVKLWDSATGHELTRVERPSNVLFLAFDPRRRSIALANEDGTVELWNPRTREIASLRQYTKPAEGVDFSPDGKWLASCSDDGTVSLWDADERRFVDEFTVDRSAVLAVALSDDGRLLAAGVDDGRVIIWDLQNHNRRQTLHAHRAQVLSVAFAPGTYTVASSGSDHRVQVWDAHTGKLVQAMDGHSDFVRSVIFSPDGSTLASGGEDSSVRLWDLASGQERVMIRGHHNWVFRLAFSTVGNLLAVGNDDGTVSLLRAASQEEVAQPMRQ